MFHGTRIGSLIALACLLPPALLTSGRPVQAAAPDPGGGTGGAPLAGSLTVTVVAADSADPIAGAWVMVGPGEGVPFAGNVGLTDGAGEIVFSDPTLLGTVQVTAGAAGRGYATLVDLAVDELVLPLVELAQPATARLGDRFEGIEVDNGSFCFGDGNLDIGLVLGAVPLEAVFGGSGLLEALTSSTTEPLATPLGPVDAPANAYLPTQCEVFGTYEKNAYHLRSPLGTTTIYGLTARGNLGAFLDLANGNGDLVTLIQGLSFREFDVLRDVAVAGDSDAIDLSADLPLAADLNLNVSNVPALTSVYAAGGGRVTGLDGAQELLLTGFDAFDPDTDGPAAALTVTTRPASGELADMVHGALAVAIGDPGNDGATLALRRTGVTPPATLTFDSFFEIVQLQRPDPWSLAWSDVTSATSPPFRDVNRTLLVYERDVPNPDDPAQTATESATYWTVLSAGAVGGISLPALPPTAPTPLPDPSGTPDADRFVLAHQVLFLGDTTFAYDAFGWNDLVDFSTHVASGNLSLDCDTQSEITNLRLARGGVSGQVRLSWDASSDICHDIFASRSYEVYAAASPVPATPPGAFPGDPSFTEITSSDGDGNLRDETFTDAPPPGLVVYLVADRGLSGNVGPVGHYP